MVIRFSKSEADKPRGIILTTKCAEELEAIRKRNKACQAETVSPALGQIEQKSISHHASKDLVHTGSKIRIGTHDIEGQEIRLSISHDGVYSTAVAISQLDDFGTIHTEQENDGCAAFREAESEMGDDKLQRAEARRGYKRHDVHKQAFKRLDLRKAGEAGQTTNTLPGSTHYVGEQKRTDLNKDDENVEKAETSFEDVPQATAWSDHWGVDKQLESSIVKGKKPPWA